VTKLAKVTVVDVFARSDGNAELILRRAL